ncbi:Short-chain dehydrogenase [Balamuthia mandrillaris]
MATQKPVALITGTSTGIGLSAAILLAKADFHVVATMRNLDKATELKERAQKEGVEVELQQLDVSSLESINRCVEQVIATHGNIALLVNNAGAGQLGSLEQVSEKDLRSAMEVNFFGVWQLTKAVLPHMRRARSGRVISVTSVGGLIGQPFNDAYCAAKFAVEGAMESLAPVTKRFGVDIVLVEPGAVHSAFVENVLAKGSVATVEGDEEQFYSKLLESYVAGTKDAYAMGQTSDEVAEVIVKAAKEEKPHLRYQTSAFIEAICGKKISDITGDSIVDLTGSRL